MKTYRVVVKASQAERREANILLTPVELRGIVKVGMFLQQKEKMYGPRIYVYDEEGLRVL